MQLTDINDLNNIIKFLALRNINELTSEALFNKFQISQVDLIIILGNSVPYITEWVANAYKSGLAQEIMIAGGIGHATKFLIQNVLRDDKYKDVDVIDQSEAEILNQILVKYENIEQDKIILENKSTNCGSNAKEALKILREKGKIPTSILLVQDPTMQIRSYASFIKEWEQEKTLIISYAPFIPQLKISQTEYEFTNIDINGLWDEIRYIDLIMGEIPRLRDDSNGYGPKGKGHIAHVDIPHDVLSSYQRLLTYYSEYNQIKNRRC